MAELDLSARSLTSLDSLIPSLPANLHTLNLSNNLLTALPDLSQLVSLEHLDLTGNPFPDAESVATALLMLPALTSLNVDLELREVKVLTAHLPNLQLINGRRAHVSEFQDKVNSLFAQVKLLRTAPPSARDDRIEARLFELSADLEAKEEAATTNQYQRRSLLITKRAFLACLKDAIKPLLAESLHTVVAQAEALENSLFLELADLAPTRPVSITPLSSPRKVEESDSVKIEIEDELLQNSPRRVTAAPADLHMDNIALRARVEGLEADVMSLLNSAKATAEEEALLMREVEELRKTQSFLEAELQSYREIFEREKSHEASDQNEPQTIEKPHIRSAQSPLYRSLSQERARASQARSLRHSTVGEGRTLSRKALLACIAEVYESKARSDQRNWDSRLPRETPAEHLQHYLSTKYGLKVSCKQTIRDRWEVGMFAALGVHSQNDCDVELFGKLLRSQLDEGYRSSHETLKIRILSCLNDVTSRRRRRFSSNSLNESEAQDVISSLFPAEDQPILLEILKALGQQLVLRRDMPVTRPGSTHYHASVLLHVLLKYRLQHHCERLSGFLTAFQKLDSDGDGRLTQSELRALLREAGMGEDQVLAMLRAIDPTNLQVATLSECVAVLSEHKGHLQLWH